MLSDEPQIQFAVYHNIGLYLINPIHIMSVDSSHVAIDIRDDGVRCDSGVSVDVHDNVVCGGELKTQVMPDAPDVQNTNAVGCCIIM